MSWNNICWTVVLVTFPLLSCCYGYLQLDKACALFKVLDHEEVKKGGHVSEQHEAG